MGPKIPWSSGRPSQAVTLILGRVWQDPTATRPRPLVEVPAWWTGLKATGGCCPCSPLGGQDRPRPVRRAFAGPGAGRSRQRVGLRSPGALASVPGAPLCPLKWVQLMVPQPLPSRVRWASFSLRLARWCGVALVRGPWDLQTQSRQQDAPCCVKSLVTGLGTREPKRWVYLAVGTFLR